MVRDNAFKTEDGQYYIVREYDNGNISFIFKKEEFSFIKKYDDETLKKFKTLYDNLNGLLYTFRNPTIKDITMPRFEFLIQETEKALERYERIVPKEFRNKFNFDKGKLEELISSLQKEFFGNGSENGKIIKKNHKCYLKKM
ncbi:MAG: hypothetical protein ACP5NZ_05055 [Nanobdellota archaeon]